eukprot:c25384_g1_i1.p1 GENE.c25384_g1_i1~~c25384_g1_i1.p1  ORF type:complete len:385 (-),score=82.06 c25384_g1_i1:21-1013(-)
MYELGFTTSDVRNLLAAIQPFSRFEEAKENVVLMDEFPYVPIIELPAFNSVAILSNLVLDQQVNLDLIKVDFDKGFQSIYFLDIPMNATFDWRFNNSDIHGKVTARIPHAWLHQNIETSCVRQLPNLLTWEGRVDLTIDGLDISTSCTNRSLVDALAVGLNQSRHLKKYIANALHHQLTKFTADLHWKSQSFMRDLCLQCNNIRYNSSLIVFQLKGDKSCLNSMPSFFIDSLSDDKARPADLQAVAMSALKAALVKQYRGTPELQTQVLQSTDSKAIQHENLETLTPRIDPRKRFKHQVPEGFIDETEVSPWKARFGQLFGSWQTQNKTK